MAAPVLQPIRTGNMTSITSSLDEAQSKTHDKVKLRTKEVTDPLRVLEPVTKKLTSLEAQRVMAVLEDSIRRVEISTILPYIVENLSRFSIVLGLELVRVLEEHYKLQSNYQKAFAQLELEKKRFKSLEEKYTSQCERVDSEPFFDGDEGTKALNNRTESSLKILTKEDIIVASDKVQKELEVVNSLQDQLKQSLKTVLRLFVRNPAALDSLRNEKKERSHEANDLIAQLTALKGHLLERLLRTPLELRERNDYMRTVTEKERKSNQQAEKLQQELAAAIEDKENEASEINCSVSCAQRNIENRFHHNVPTVSSSNGQLSCCSSKNCS